MKKYLLLIICVAVFSCKQNTTESSEIIDETNKVNQTSKMIEDDIQVVTIQIGGESDSQKNKFQASYPQTKYQFINDIEKNRAEKFQQEFEQEAKQQPNDAVAGLTFGSHFDVIANTNQLIGFLHEKYRSYGNTFSDDFETVYYDLTDKKQLHFGDMFASQKDFNSFAEIVKNAVQQNLKSKLAKDNSLTEGDKNKLMESLEDQIEEGTKAIPENYSSVVFKKDIVEVVFDKYQVAPGNMGSIKVDLQSKDVADLIAKKYQSLFQIENGKKIGLLEPNQSKKKVITSVPNSNNVNCDEVPCIALTFDDGPSVHTNRLLDILKSEDVKATFFVLGQSSKVQKNTILRQKNEGHTVANHSWNHKDLTKLNLEEVSQQINETNSMLTSITGDSVRYLRPPYGASTAETKKIYHMPIILWSLDPLDWKDRNADIVAERILQAKANGIILAHDIHKSTVDAIPTVLKKLKEKGFYFVSLDELYAGKTLENGKVYNKR